jgi:D-aminoacyl-tRNA deacylase
MTVLIIASNIDPASTNIKNSLLNQSNWETINSFHNNPIYKNKKYDLIIASINDQKIYHDDIDIEFSKETGITPKNAIFISRHTSKTGNPTLTVHPIGNYGEALFGGEEKTLVKSSPKIMTELLRLLKKNSNYFNLYHNICFEVTHHGPKISIPSLFIEIGSTLDEWTKKKSADTISKTLLDFFEKHNESTNQIDIPVLAGLGGGHYAPRFTDVALERKVAFGHMIPTYQINAGVIDENIIEKIIDNTPEIYGLYVHKKALKKSQITHYKEIFNSKGIKTISSKDFEKID